MHCTGRVWSVSLGVAVLMTIGLGTARPVSAADHVVSILPLRALVAELSGNEPEAIDVIVGPGATPALYEPTARQMVGLSRARALFVVGVPFETTFLPRVRARFSDLRIVDVAAGMERDELPEVGHEDHGHAHELDPHLWTDPQRVLRMIDTIAVALAELEPDEARAIAMRRDAMRARWEALDREIEAATEDVQPRVIAVFHPAFGYFAARYGFLQVAVQAGGTEAGARHMTDLARRVRELGVDRLFVQPQFSPQRARTIARSLGVEVVEIDPLDPDTPGMLRRLASLLAGAPSGARH